MAGEEALFGYSSAQPLMDQISRLSGPVAFFKNLPEILFLAFAICAIVVAFCVITVQVVTALLTFKFGSLAAFVLVPFAVLSKTAFIAERPLGWVVGSGIRLMVLTLVLGVGNNVFQKLQLPPGQTVTTYEAFCVALAAILLMVLSLVASRLASDLIIGGPSLGVGTAINTMAVAQNSITNAVGARPAVLATKAASVVTTKGVSLGVMAGKAAYGGLKKLASSGTNTATSSTLPNKPASPTPGVVGKAAVTGAKGAGGPSGAPKTGGTKP